MHPVPSTKQHPEKISELPEAPTVDELLDAALEMTFPSSDPVALAAPHADPTADDANHRPRG